MRVYDADKVWSLMSQEEFAIARCTVERLMKRLGLQSVRLGMVVRTTICELKAPCPLDRVNRQFRADRPNQVWVSDFTYVSTWQGWLYLAIVIDVYARRVVGWRASSSMHTDFVLDALEQALYDRQPQCDGAVTHYSDRGSQYVSIRCSERLAEAGIEPSVGSKGTAMTMPWPRRSTGCTWRRRLAASPVQPANPWSWQPWNGYPGSTITDCSDPSATSRWQKLRQTTTGNSPIRQPKWTPDLNQTASTKPRAVQCAFLVRRRLQNRSDWAKKNEKLASVLVMVSEY